MSKALYDVADFFKNETMLTRTRDLVVREITTIQPQLMEMRKELEGKKTAIYVGGAFKAFSLVRALRLLGVSTAIAGTQTGKKEDYQALKNLCDEGTIILDDSNPVELSHFIEGKDVDLLIGGVKERPIAYKLGVGFCDHNHERKIPLAGYEGMMHFAREVYSSCMSPVWQFAERRRGDCNGTK
jgi:nitrogenase molybdenum-cofactor synthesis protein NifE